MIKPSLRFTLTIVIILAGVTSASSQTAIPEVLTKGTLKEQMNYLEEKTRVYETYRAIREDLFQQIKRNAIDSLEKVQGQVFRLTEMNRNQVSKTDSLNILLASTLEQLDEAVRTKNSINVIGMDINKHTYNSILWIIVAGLLVILVIGFLAFRRNRYITLTTKKDLAELKTEFEAYRQKTRLDREKMDMDHFNELRKLRGN